MWTWCAHATAYDLEHCREFCGILDPQPIGSHIFASCWCFNQHLERDETHFGHTTLRPTESGVHRHMLFTCELPQTETKKRKDDNVERGTNANYSPSSPLLAEMNEWVETGRITNPYVSHTVARGGSLISSDPTEEKWSPRILSKLLQAWVP